MLLICLNSTIFVLLGFFTLIETICPNVCSKSRLKSPGSGVLSYKRLIGMCRLMGSHFHDGIDCNGVAFSIEFLEWGRKFSDFWAE